ncbi:hypothetical protein [Streptomyces radiopugnans]|uniref:hypothetical protein n=1 Tax=Streptomyces radiopugnans TaxID=403935 RepID=UPI003F1B7E40
MSARRRFTATLLVALAAVLGPTAAGMASQAGPQTAAAGGSAYGCPSDSLGNPLPGDCTEDTHW